KRTLKRDTMNRDAALGIKRWAGIHIAVENNSVGPFIDDANVTRKLASARTRKQHEQPKSLRNERERNRRHRLTNTLQVEHAGLDLTFTNSVAYRHDPDTWRQSRSSSHRAIPLCL